MYMDSYDEALELLKNGFQDDDGEGEVKREGEDGTGSDSRTGHSSAVSEGSDYSPNIEGMATTGSGSGSGSEALRGVKGAGAGVGGGGRSQMM